VRALGGTLLVALALAAAGLAWCWARPNRARVHPALAAVLEHWPAVADGLHNSNTDLARLGPDLLLVHAASPWHFGSKRSRLVVRRSADGRQWETLATLRVPGRDVRDPKLAWIGGRLHLYALANDDVTATPGATLLATSGDAREWTPFEPVGPPGWLFWRPKSPDGGATWYVPAYWHGHGRSILLRSGDGRAWTEVSEIHAGEGNDETAIEFLPDGRLLATARLEIAPDSFFGHRDAHTLLAVAEPPYTAWKKARSRVTRLDGPVLFSHAGRVFAVARFQPDPYGPFTRPASVLARKRTALFEVREDALVHLSDLPSAGDTAYAGAVLRDGTLWLDWYTSDVRRDWPWLLGMLLPSEIRVARLPADALLALADAAGREARARDRLGTSSRSE
jgi:hypothetical protein